jgi:hypothetical protein
MDGAQSEQTFGLRDGPREMCELGGDGRSELMAMGRVVRTRGETRNHETNGTVDCRRRRRTAW